MENLHTALVGFVILLLLLSLSSFFLRTQGRLPPGPPAWPFVGHLHLLGKLPHHSLFRLSNQYGPITYIRLGSVGTVVASSADMAKEFLKTHDHIFASRPKFAANKILAYDCQDITFTNCGPHWRKLRMICQLELFSPKRIEDFRSIREGEIFSMLSAVWEESKEGKVVDISVELSTLSTNIMTLMTLGKKYFGSGTPEALEFKDTIDEQEYLLGAFNLGDYIPYIKWLDLQGFERRMRAAHKRMDAFLQRTVEEHRRKSGTTANYTSDLLDVLLHHGSSVDEQLSDDIIKAVIQDMIVAGTDTASVTIEWAMAELLRNPLLLNKIQAELDSVVGRERTLSESDISKLKFLQAVVKETFRLHPAAPLMLPHESTEPCRVAGYDIPNQTRLIVNVWAIGRDENIWKNPLEFDPERFMNSSIDVRGFHFELIPFGAGRRSCPGYALGLCMVQTTLARLVHCFDWSLPSDCSDLDMTEAPSLTLQKAVPLKAVPRPRLSKELLVGCLN